MHAACDWIHGLEFTGVRWLTGDLHVAALFGANMAERSLCVAVARLRRSPAVSREDCGGAELLHSADEVCNTVCVCLCVQESLFNQMFL